MHKKSRAFILAEYVYNLAIPAARGRKMISLIDPEKVPIEHQADRASYRNAILCCGGGLALLLIFPRTETLVVAIALALYGYRRAERFYPHLAESLAGLFPSAKNDGKTIAERWADMTVEGTAARAAQTEPVERTSGGGPWLVYTIDTDGVEKRLPRRFETDIGAQRYADLQLVLSRGKITHVGVTYEPER